MGKGTTAWLLLTLVISASAVWAGPDGGAYKRWAILATPAATEAKMPDLLLAELSQAPDLELVERQQLQAAVQELTVATVLGSDGRAQRLRLGQILKADALLLVDLEGTGKDKSLRLVVAECRYGARLKVETMPWQPDQAEALVARAKAVVAETRQRFAGGIQAILGVPAFVSRSLGRDHDALQEGYARLLESLLALQPGIAVLATDEARAIGQEMALAPGDAAKRLVPIFVEGEYRVEPRPGEEPVVRLTAKILHGGASRQLESGQLPLSGGGPWVSTELVAAVVKDLPNAVPMTVPQQTAALVERADAFAMLGSLEHSIPLREASLLLDPDLAKQRVVLIKEIRRLATERLPRPLPVTEQARWAKALEPAVQRFVEADGLAFDHLEYLITHRQIRAPEAIDLALLRAGNFVLDYCRQSRMLTPDGRYFGFEHLSKLERNEERFYREVFPQVIQKLPMPDKDSAFFGQLNHWQQVLLGATAERWDRAYITREDLNQYYRVLTELVPEGLEVPECTILRPWVARQYSEAHPAGPGAITDQDWSRFAERLRDSKHRTASLLGRYLLLEQQVEAGDHKDLPGLRRESEALDRDTMALRYARNQRPYDTSRFLSEVRSQGRRIDQSLRPQTHSVAATRPTTRPGTGALRVQPVSLNVRRLDGSVVPLQGLRWAYPRDTTGFVEHIVSAGKGQDVIWGGGVILLHRRKELLEELVVNQNVRFLNVQWDGEFLWVATRYDGLWVMNLDGKIVGKIKKEQGLPSSDGPKEAELLLQPLDPGRVAAIGTVEGATWCALVQWRDGAGTVQLIHEATHHRTEGADESSASLKNSLLAFYPRWLHLHRSAGDNPRLLLLAGRQGKPLAIDMKSLKVSVLDEMATGSTHNYDNSYFSWEGALLEASPDGPVRLYPSLGGVPAEKPASRMVPVVNPAEIGNGASNNTLGKVRVIYDGTDGILLYVDGWVYVPGPVWYRIDPKTMIAQRLTDRGSRETEPLLRRLRWIGASCHYGILTWTPEFMAQMTVDESAIPPAAHSDVKADPHRPDRQ